MISTFPNTIIKGALSTFIERMNASPNVWRSIVQPYASQTKTETISFVGSIPKPREMLDGRTIQQFRDYKFTVADKTYELTLFIDREDLEDQQVDRVTEKFSDAGESFGAFKDQLMGTRLADGDTTAPPINSADGITWSTYYTSSGTIGDSGTLDNTISVAAATGTSPTAAEFLTAINDAKTQLRTMKDDNGRVGYNRQAINTVHAIIPPQLEDVAFQAANAAFIPTVDGNTNVDNVFKGLFTFDVLDDLTDATKMFVQAMGSSRKPFLMQERMGLELLVDSDPIVIAKQNGVMVLARERFHVEYGDPRRSIEVTFT